MNNQSLGFTNGKVGVGTASPTSVLHSAGSFASPIRTTTTNTTLDENDFTLILYGQDLIITLPSPNTCPGRMYIIKNLGDGDADTNMNYLKSNGDPETKIAKEKTYWLQSDGTNWQELTRN